jgi:uncharacterized protein RhaS with RHS repeats
MPSPNPIAYVGNPFLEIDPLGLAPCARAQWAAKADFSNPSTLAKKYDAHAGDFGITGNKNNVNLAAFRDAMKSHMTADGTKIYRYNYRKQGQAIGFINPTSGKMVMLRADTGKFWSAWKLSDRQFSGITDKGLLW